MDGKKHSCNLLTAIIIMILLVNIAILISVKPTYTFAVLTRISNRYQNRTYQNIESEYKLDYPYNWRKISEINRNSNYSNVLFATPVNQFPNLKSLFSVTVEKFASCKSNMNVIAKESCNERPTEMQSKRYIQELNDLKRNSYVVDYSTKNTTLSGLSTRQITFKTSALGGLQKLEISTAHDGKLYTLTYIAKPKIFQKNITIVQSAIASFQILS
jgi:hypothetical protein